MHDLQEVFKSWTETTNQGLQPQLQLQRRGADGLVQVPGLVVCPDDRRSHAVQDRHSM